MGNQYISWFFVLNLDDYTLIYITIDKLTSNLLLKTLIAKLQKAIHALPIIYSIEL